jgi:hypothetical protein
MGVWMVCQGQGTGCLQVRRRLSLVQPPCAVTCFKFQHSLACVPPPACHDCTCVTGYYPAGCSALHLQASWHMAATQTVATAACCLWLCPCAGTWTDFDSHAGSGRSSDNAVCAKAGMATACSNRAETGDSGSGRKWPNQRRRRLLLL